MMTIYEKTSLPNRVVYLLLIFVQNNIVFLLFLFFFWKIYTLFFLFFSCPVCVFCFLFTIVHFTKKFFFFFCSMYARVCVPSRSAQKYKSQFGQINIKENVLFDLSVIELLVTVLRDSTTTYRRRLDLWLIT